MITLKRICKQCLETYHAEKSTADKNIWGFCSEKCERQYEYEERTLEIRRNG